MFLNQMGVNKNPSAPIHQKQAFHPCVWVSQPRIGAKTVSEKYCEALKMAEARPRSAEGNQAATMRPLPGKTGACATPEMSLRTKIAVNPSDAPRYPANPVRKAQIDHKTILR